MGLGEGVVCDRGLGVVSGDRSYVRVRKIKGGGFGRLFCHCLILLIGVVEVWSNDNSLSLIIVPIAYSVVWIRTVPIAIVFPTFLDGVDRIV